MAVPVSPVTLFVVEEDLVDHIAVSYLDPQDPGYDESVHLSFWENQPSHLCCFPGQMTLQDPEAVSGKRESCQGGALMSDESVAGMKEDFGVEQHWQKEEKSPGAVNVVSQ